MKPKYFAIALAGCLLAASVFGTTAVACCHSCQAQVCCCPAPPPPPPPVKVKLCVKDPCNCCTYEVDICLPACCCGEEPCVKWRRGFLGRKIATYCWPCCDHEVDVVVTRHGRAFAR